jgi:protein-disulfide isomerase
VSKKKKSGKARARPAAERKSQGASAPEVPEPGGVNRLGVVVAVVLLAGLATAVAIVGKRPAVGRPGEVAREETPASGPDEPDQSVESAGKPKTIDIPLYPTDYARGPSNAPVTLVEFSDFECPFCKEANVSLDAIVKLYPEVRQVFKNFPLDTACNPYVGSQLHPLACLAARLARCAGRQGRFWEIHDAMFGLSEMTEDALDALPASLGLDEKQIASCMVEEDTVARIRADVDEGRKLGVSATPTLYLNGRETPNYSIGNLKFVVEKILKANEVRSP